MTPTRTTVKTTHELAPGDRVLLAGRLIRTVDRLGPTGWVNWADEEIVGVWWAEGSTPEWSGGNSGAPSTTWTVVR